MNRTAFYKHLRRRDVSTFGTSLSQGQVYGIEAILDAGKGHPLPWLAYGLATARGEVGPKMQPVEENLRYSASRIPKVFSTQRRQGMPAAKLAGNPKLLANTVYGGPWGAKNLGNVKEGDGWRYRGRGYPQVTGRRNYEKLAAITGLDLVNNPDLVAERSIAASVSIFYAMENGIYTGKAFRHYLTEDVATFQQFKDARWIVNGQFHAAKIAGFAVDFQNALIAAGYSPVYVPVDVPAQPEIKPPSKPIPQVAQEAASEKPKSGFGALLAMVLGLFGGKK